MTKDYMIKFKEQSPEATVSQIQDILKGLDITVEESWMDVSEIGTYSLRIWPKGITSIGSNGKGVTKAYARASAYAEFMERLQNIRLTPEGQLYRIFKRNPDLCYSFSNEKILTIDELIDDNSAFLQVFLKKRGLLYADRQRKVEELRQIQKSDMMILGQADRFVCTPFYSVKEKRTCYIPSVLNCMFYASNGMCAGNTLAEALIQGISEIYERYTNHRVLIEMPSLPDVPEEVIKRYPYIYDMYLQVKNNDNFMVYLKDASLGGIFPVAAMVLVEKNTGKFGVKLGAHPDFGIAMERVFTEATQGISLADYSKKSYLSFFNEDVHDSNNLINSFITSDAQYPYQILLEPPTFRYHEFTDVQKLTNKDLLQAEIKKIIDNDMDILIHNCSFAGFPSCQVVIPGISEIDQGDFSNEHINMLVSTIAEQDLICHPELLNDKNIKKIIESLQISQGRILKHNLYHFTGVTSSYEYPGQKKGVDILYMITLCSLQIQDYTLASDTACTMLNKVRVWFPDDELTEYVFLSQYANGMKVFGDHDKVINYMRYMFEEEICDEFDKKLCDPSRILASIYPLIDLEGPYCQNFKNYEKFLNKIKNYQLKNPIDETVLPQFIESLMK